MANDEKTTRRIRELLLHQPNVQEKKMFSGITFMVNDKMCISVGPQRIMCRIDPAMHDEAIKKEGVQAVVMRGRAMIGYVYVSLDSIRSKKSLDYWVARCLAFNEHAKSSKKKGK